MSVARDSDSGKRPAKSASAFRTISEVSDELDVPQHVLRFWETKFAQVSPMKRGGGRRYYRPEDVDLLRRIRDLLYSDGYTIKGVQKLLRETRGKLTGNSATGAAGTSTSGASATGARPIASMPAKDLDPDTQHELRNILQQLETLKQKLADAMN